MAFKLFDRVQEISTSTGTGNFTLAGAVTGFSTFSSRYSTGDTLYYGIHAVDSNGTPTGDWEIGLGTYSGANTLTRTTVLSSSNSDAAVTFGAGTKRVFVTMTALQGKSIRENVTTNRTYYVATTGSDTANTGLAVGSPFLTIQKAVDVVSSTLDIAAGVTVTIQVADGTYTSGAVLKRFVGAGNVVVQGNTTTPANCIVSTTGEDCFVAPGPTYSVAGFNLRTTTTGTGLSAQSGGNIFFSNIDFGACAWYHIIAYGGNVYASSNYTISGGSQAHIYCLSFGFVSTNSRTVTLTGTPAFSTAFVWMDRGLGQADVFGMTFSGTATGKRYIVNNNSVCFVNGAASTYLPGSVAGTTATGGVYA